MKKYKKFPGEVNDFYNPGIALWWDFYGWLSLIDPTKVAVMIDSTFPPKQFSSGIKAVVCTSFEVDPRIKDLEKLAASRPDLPFIWLCDSDLYDYKLPENIIHVRYRHFHLRQKQFMMNFDPNRVIRAKNKNFNKKFSSMSWWSRQNRALVTAALLTHARDQSFLSWHGVQKNYDPTVDLIENNVTFTFDYQHHGQLINSLVTHPKFKDLDWSFIDSDITFDSFNISNNFTEYNLGDIHHPGYENTIINFTNETSSFGLFVEGDTSYIRPGPYLNEKTIKPLLTGTVCFNTGQPFLYKFFRERYEIDCTYKLITLDFDNMAGDIDRYISIVDSIKTMADMPLLDLVDANIDLVEQIQNTLLDPSWFDHIQNLNKKEEQEVLDLLAKFV